MQLCKIIQILIINFNADQKIIPCHKSTILHSVSIKKKLDFLSKNTRKNFILKFVKIVKFFVCSEWDYVLFIKIFLRLFIDDPLFLSKCLSQKFCFGVLATIETSKYIKWKVISRSVTVHLVLNTSDDFAYTLLRKFPMKCLDFTYVFLNLNSLYAFLSAFYS